MKLALLIALLLSSVAFADCKDDNFDVYKVANAHMHGADKDNFLAHVNAAPDVDEERKVRIRALVDEVFAMPQDEVPKWRHEHTANCADA